MLMLKHFKNHRIYENCLPEEKMTANLIENKIFGNLKL